MRKLRLLLAGLGSLLIPGLPAWGLESAPFPVRNQNPLVQIFGLPAAAGGRVTPSGRTEAGLTTQTASHFTFSTRQEESIFLDGETYRFDLFCRRGLAAGVEIGAELPLLRHRGGFLDSFIVDWHDLFGLPQNRRDQSPRDRLLFTYAEDGRERLRLDESAGGPGDLRLTGAWALRSAGNRSAALRASLKLPTGDSDRLLGSGSTDFALWVSGEQDFATAASGFTLFGGAGGMVLTDGDILPDRQQNLVGFGTLGGAWRPLDLLTFKIQVDGHTPFYDSDLPQLGESLQLTLGGTLDWGDTALDLAVGEDIAVDTAPDVTFLLALRHLF